MKQANACFYTQIFYAVFMATLFEETAAETNSYVSKKKTVQQAPAVSKTCNFVSPGVP
jgi:hypothetical protein